MTNETLGKGREASNEIGGRIAADAADLGDTAREEAAKLADRARSIGHDHAERQFDQGKQRVESQVDTIQHAVSDAADRLDEEGHPLATYANELSAQLSGLSSKIENSTLDDLARDARRLARDNPGLFMLGAVAVGFAASRFLKASDSDARAPSTSRPGSSSGFDGLDGGYRSPIAERDYRRSMGSARTPVSMDSSSAPPTSIGSSDTTATPLEPRINRPVGNIGAGASDTASPTDERGEKA